MRFWLAFFVVGAVAGAVACYSPNFGSPGYYCDPDSHPACPDGQECVNGQCQNGGSNNNPGDMSIAGGDLKGAKSDMKGGNSPDLTQPQSGGGCDSLANCYLNAQSDQDTQACIDASSSDAQTLLESAIECAIGYCEDSTFECEDDGTGNPTDSGFGPESCNDCLVDVMSKLYPTTCSGTGSDCNASVCKSDVNACLND